MSASPLILTSPMEGRNYYSLRLKIQMLGKDGLFIQGHTASKKCPKSNTGLSGFKKIKQITKQKVTLH